MSEENTDGIAVPDEEMLKRHQAAEATVKSFHYEKPSGGKSRQGPRQSRQGRHRARRRADREEERRREQPALSHHAASFWMVLKGRVRFYGPDDVLIGEFGPHEGTITPRYARYWFENVGDEDLEILQVGAYADPATERAAAVPTPSPQRYQIHTSDRYEGVIDKKD